MKLRKILTVLTMFFCFAACTKNKQPPEQEIHIGHFASLSGAFAKFGQAAENGLRLAYDEMPEKAVLGKKIIVITYDDKSSPEATATNVNNLIKNDHVVALLGEVSSSLSLVASDIAMLQKIPMLSPASTSPNVTKKGEYIFRICYVDSYQGSILAKFARETLKAKNIAIIRDVKNDYSEGLANFFSQAFTTSGGHIAIDSSYQADDKDFSSQLLDIKAVNPDLIFLPGYYQDIANIIVQARKLGMSQTFIGGDGWAISESLYKNAGHAVDGSYFSDHFALDSNDPKAIQFIASYTKKYKQAPNSMAALGYDAFSVLLDSLKRAKSLDPQSIRDAIAETKKFPGVTGNITINKQRNAIKPAFILKLSAGQAHLFKEMSLE